MLNPQRHLGIPGIHQVAGEAKLGADNGLLQLQGQRENIEILIGDGQLQSVVEIDLHATGIEAKIIHIGPGTETGGGDLVLGGIAGKLGPRHQAATTGALYLADTGGRQQLSARVKLRC